VRARFGVAPALVPDWLALVGDGVDDLPGVPGFGPKSAALLLSAFGSIDAIPDDPARWVGVPVRGAARLAAALADHRAQARAVRELATVVRDVPGLPARLDDLLWRGADPDRFDALCARLGWGRIASRVPRWRAPRDASRT
jgi:5'-3' exonuclease